jgi:hypothetical protein
MMLMTNRIVREEVLHSQIFHVVVLLGVCQAEGRLKLNQVGRIHTHQAHTAADGNEENSVEIEPR